MIERLLSAGPHHQVRVRCTDRGDGDFRVDAPAAALAERRTSLAPGPWTWLHQVHGAVVVSVDSCGGGAGLEADGCFTTVTGAVLAIHTADCAPVVLIGDGVLAAVHAGWRGIVAGVIPRAIDRMRSRRPGPVRAALGPCIDACAYEFGVEDLDAVVAVVGETARSTARSGAPALDLAAAVKAQCLSHGVTSFERISATDQQPTDTSDPRWFSHRTRHEEGRQVTVAWLESV